MDFLKSKNIDICIPCLLAYDNSNIYSETMNIENKMKVEMNWMKHYFEKNFKFEDIKPKLIFIIFPIENIEALRGNEEFYAGLC